MMHFDHVDLYLQQETDVDCGGSCAKKCSENATCTQDSDCISAYFCWTEAQRVEMYVFSELSIGSG